MKRSISKELTIWLSVTTSLFFATLGAITYFYISYSNEIELNEKFKNISEEFVDVIKMPIYELNFLTVEKISEAYLQSEYLNGLKIVNQVGQNIIYEKINGALSIQVGKDVFFEDVKICHVEFYFSNIQLIKLKQMMIKVTVSIICLAILIILLVTSTITKIFLNRPLFKLIDGLRTIADGRYELKLPHVPQYEIDTIIKEVNSMADQVQQRELQQKEAERALLKSENKYRSIFENALEGIYQVGHDGFIINVNPSFANMLGYDTPQEMISDNVELKKVFVNEENYRDYYNALQKEGLVSEMECQFNKSDQTKIWVSIQARANLGEDGLFISVEGLISDISARKQAENAEKKYKAELEERVAERTLRLADANVELQNKTEILEASQKELQLANDQLKNMNEDLAKKSELLRDAEKSANNAAKAKGEFLANMSHEIRTPMNGVIAAADLALTQNLTPKVEKYLRIIHGSAYSLLGIINDILDFSKIEAGKIELEETPFRVDHIIENILSMMASKSAEKRIELLGDIDYSAPLAVYGDSLRLQQVLTNLIGNAVKFTPENGMIIIGVNKVEETKSNIVKLKLFVRDTGIGIEAGNLSKLFEPFSQADASTTRKFGGTGLGLTISKHLVNMMGGELWAESVYGEGSTFNFTVTYRKQKEIKEKEFILPTEIQGLRVLVVDDNSDSRDILHNIFSSFNLIVEHAVSGVDAIAKLKEKRLKNEAIDLITMDWIMPDMDGIHTTKYIRHEMGIKVPVIMMTGFGQDEEEIKAIAAGTTIFLQKPVRKRLLYESILSAYGKKVIRTRKNVTDVRRDFQSEMQNVHLLLAEDNLTNQEIAKEILSGAGIQVTIVDNGKEAVDALSDNEFDAVLMDIQMPVMDGYEATQIIRQNPKFETLPIIAMTAHAMHGDEERGLKAGMNGYVTKPINQQSLFETLSEFIKKPSSGLNSQRENSGEGQNEIADSRVLPDELPGIQLQDALLALGIGENAYKKILIGFYNNNRQMMKKLWTAFHAEDWKLLRELAHSLKGSGANIGAINLQKITQVLETAAKDYELDKPDIQMLEKVETAFDQVMVSLSTLVEKTRSVKESKISKNEIEKDAALSLIKELNDAIDIADPGKVTDLLGQLENITGPQLIQDISEKISLYDFDEAQEDLAKLSVELSK